MQPEGRVCGAEARGLGGLGVRKLGLTAGGAGIIVIFLDGYESGNCGE